MSASAVHASCAVARPRVASSPGAKRAGVGDARRVEADARLFHYPTRRSTVARGGELSWDEAEEVLSLECVQQHRVCRHRGRRYLRPLFAVGGLGCTSASATACRKMLFWPELAMGSDPPLDQS